MCRMIDTLRSTMLSCELAGGGATTASMPNAQIASCISIGCMQWIDEQAKAEIHQGTVTTHAVQYGCSRERLVSTCVCRCMSQTICSPFMQHSAAWLISKQQKCGRNNACSVCNGVRGQQGGKARTLSEHCWRTQCGFVQQNESSTAGARFLLNTCYPRGLAMQTSE